MITLIWGTQNMTQMNLSLKQKWIHRHREQICVTKGRRGGLDGEFGVSQCKVLHLEWIDNKVLLYTAGNYIQSPGINQNETECTYVCVCIYIYTYVYVHSQLPLQETQVQSRVGKMPWRRRWQPTPEIPWTEEPGRLQSMGSQRVRHDSATNQQLSLSIYIYIHTYICIHILCN